MINKYIKNTISIVMSLIFLFSAATFSFIQVNATVYTETISLYSNVVGYLNAGDQRKYYLTVSESGYYAVQTSGTTDTYGTVSAYDETGLQYYSDDDGGYSHNCLVRFYQKANTISVITIRHYNSSSGTGQFGLQVRKQRAIYFTNHYSNGGINTEPQATVPYSITNQLGYKSVKFYNAVKTKYTQADGQSNCRYINSDIFMYSGHGSEGYITLPSSSTISESEIRNETNYRMCSTNLALWNACYSAVEPNNSATSIMNASVESGAKCAVGWASEVNPNSLVTWTNKFFDELKNGNSVNDAKNSACSQIVLFYDNCRTKCRVAGNSSTRIVTVSNSTSNNNSGQELLENELQVNLNKYNYCFYEFEDGSKRYYRTINGILTNEYYDVYPNNYIIKSNHTLDPESVNKATSLNISELEDDCQLTIEKAETKNGLVYQLEELKVETMLIQTETDIIPVKFYIADYKSDGLNGYQKILCVNLITKALIDYESINL